MRISYARRFVFLSYPRTASRSMRAVLDPVSDVIAGGWQAAGPASPYFTHAPAWHVADRMREDGHDFGAFFSFCFVRNPYHRIASLLRMHNGPKKKPRGPREADAFVDEIHRTAFSGGAGYRLPPRLSAPLRYFVTARDGSRLVSRIYRYEDLPAATRDITTRIGLPLPPGSLPRRGTRGDGPGAALPFSAESLDKIAEVYAEEIAEFGYTRPDP